MAGKVRHIGLSEASANNIRKAAEIARINCVEQEWSLWTRDIEEDIVPTCRELGIRIVAYSPLGRGFLTGAIRSLTDDAIDAKDFRAFGMPRFQGQNLQHNLQLVDGVRAFAEAKGLTPGQLALAWLHAQGDDVVPIPGTSSVAHLDQNLAALNARLTAEDLAAIEEIMSKHSIVGDRYAHMGMTFHGNK